MSIELQALGVKCNIACKYCYQDPMREAGNENPAGQYDMEKMKAALLAEGVNKSVPFSFFGGEALLMPINDLEAMIVWAHEKGIRTSLQTNASLITKRHIELFKQYNISVGVSMDGPEELNSARAAKIEGATDATTAMSQRNIELLLAEGISTSIIITLHKVNASDDEKLQRVVNWVMDFKARGLRFVNLHPLEVDTIVGASLLLTKEQNINAMRYLRKALTGLYVSPFNDMRNALLGQDEQGVNCVWHACDPYTTSAVRAVDGQGNRGNCGRTNKDGVVYGKADRASHVRQLALYLTPQQYQGCNGCRFFYACKGECPGTGTTQDWRNRTAHCEMLLAVFDDIEQECVVAGLQPISTSLIRPAVEAKLLAAWERGENISIASAVRGLTASVSGGHGDAPHGDAPHGDAPHGDSHGDHTDAGAK